MALVAPIGTLELVASFGGWTAEGHAEVKMNEVAAHLDETYFCWMGVTDDVGPFITASSPRGVRGVRSGVGFRPERVVGGLFCHETSRVEDRRSTNTAAAC